MFRIPLILFAVASCFAQASEGQRAPGREQLLKTLKALETQSGFGSTGNFTRPDPSVTGYYRCYFTGLWELPDSYDDLHLREGSQDGCSIDTEKYDVFFYPIEAVASGQTPITRALDAASDDRVAMVVPHEDFHTQVRDLPDRIAEAASTLVGFLVAEAVAEPGGSLSRPGDAELFLKKAGIVNRYYDQLSTLYRGVREGSVAKSDGLDRKRLLFAALAGECSAIAPPPRSFNRCISVMNNAGLAFDHTYTLYYPLLYRVWIAEGRDLKLTVAAIVNAPKTRRESDVVRYFSEIAATN